MLIYRHLARQLLQLTVLASCLLLMITVLARFSRYLESAIHGDIAVTAILPVLLWRLPDFLMQILPMGFLAAILIVLARMHADGELTILTSCGIGPLRLALWLQSIAVAVLLLVALLGLLITPYAMSRVDQILQRPEGIEWINSLQNGRFYEDRTGRVLHVDELLPGSQHTQARGVFIAEPDPQHRNGIRLLAARLATILIRDDGRVHLQLQLGEIYAEQKRGEQISSAKFALMNRTLEDTLVQERRNISLRGRSTRQLLQHDSPENRAQLYWRLSLPLMVMMAALLGFAMAGGMAPRRGRRLLALVPAFAFYFIYLGSIGTVSDEIAAGRMRAWPVFWPVHVAVLLPALALALYFNRFRGGSARAPTVSAG